MAKEYIEDDFARMLSESGYSDKAIQYFQPEFRKYYRKKTIRTGPIRVKLSSE